ncbi:uncharacterized protein TrAtP1_004921 [Trichoderma atroviride]|uniref:uncharacterized protein n=1 Tax=Hypocrea atroviridis TaxID=63577 RepID=UPI00332A62A8|nr:hypothetical protein TrAtP1_004921 [Trichoderma atroviride]
MVFNAIIRNSAIPVVLLYIPKSHQKEDGVMDDNRTISQSIFGHDARIIQGDVIGGSVLVTNNYGTSSQGTDKRDGEDDILRRLYTSPYEDRKDRNPPRVPGTCEWFTSHELFKEWERSDSSRLLWVSADPGCGKSVLVRHLVEYVLQTTESRTVCYFFFKDDFPDQKTVVNALRCILRQLFIQKPLLFSDKVLRRFVTGGETFFHSFTELWKPLSRFLKTRMPVKSSVSWMRSTNVKIKGLSLLKSYANFMVLRMTFI